MNLGEKAPNFALKGVDGKTHSLADFKEARALVVIFSCNHCPYVKAYEERLVAAQADYTLKGVRLVAINSNDAVNYPEDGFAEMVRRAEERGFNFPYLRDETQETARRYGATHTPQLFVFDAERALAYTGKIDDNWQNPEAAARHYLREALDDIAAGRPVRQPQTHAIGCTIKWKK
ncbi:MAG: thioredoxin family protein [Elusimicrobia bacterium]|nr:thioredoxin family protein [Elusimicrobiota bacterium]